MAVRSLPEELSSYFSPGSRRLGKGANATVFEVRRKADGKRYALKLTDTKQVKPADAVSEAALICTLSHPGLIKGYESFVCGQQLCVVMELAEGGTLNCVIRRHAAMRQYLPEETLWGLILQLCDVVHYLHINSVAHRDIKPTNIMVARDGSLKLGDLGSAKLMIDPLTQSFKGTPVYMSPEAWSKQPYSVATDVWSLGCVFYELAAVRPAFDGITGKHLYVKVMAGMHSGAIPGHYSAELWTFIRSLMVPEAVRPSLAELLASPQLASRMHLLGRPPSCGVYQDLTVLDALENNAELVSLVEHPPDALYDWVNGALPPPRYASGLGFNDLRQAQQYAGQPAQAALGAVPAWASKQSSAAAANHALAMAGVWLAAGKPSGQGEHQKEQKQEPARPTFNLQAHAGGLGLGAKPDHAPAHLRTPKLPQAQRPPGSPAGVHVSTPGIQDVPGVSARPAQLHPRFAALVAAAAQPAAVVQGSSISLSPVTSAPPTRSRDQQWQGAGREPGVAKVEAPGLSLIQGHYVHRRGSSGVAVASGAAVPAAQDNEAVLLGSAGRASWGKAAHLPPLARPPGLHAHPDHRQAEPGLPPLALDSLSLEEWLPLHERVVTQQHVLEAQRREMQQLRAGRCAQQQQQQQQPAPEVAAQVIKPLHTSVVKALLRKLSTKGRAGQGEAKQAAASKATEPDLVKTSAASTRSSAGSCRSSHSSWEGSQRSGLEARSSCTAVEAAAAAKAGASSPGQPAGDRPRRVPWLLRCTSRCSPVAE